MEIFGFSDEEGDSKFFVMKRFYCLIKLEDGIKICDTRFDGIFLRNKLYVVFDFLETDVFFYILLYYVKMGFFCINVFIENGKEVMIIGKRCLVSDL